MSVLSGLKIIEFAGQGPGPFCAMLLADLGADVIRINRVPPVRTLNTGYDPIKRGRPEIQIDLKRKEGSAFALQLIQKADALIEGHRPGVMERLGLGPDECLAINPALVYGRVTGWGQEGPLSQSPGRDINYVALSGALGAIGQSKPTPPLNLVGDYGGGGMLLCVGILAALLEARSTGQGQVVDAAMVDGAALLMTSIYGLLGNSQWIDQRGSNLLDGGAPSYATYQCSDEKWVAVGAIDQRSLQALLRVVNNTEFCPHSALDREKWPQLRTVLEKAFRNKPRQWWCEHPEAPDACISPILTMTEASEHPHNKQRSSFRNYRGCVEPAPAPRFSNHRNNQHSNKPKNEIDYILIEIFGVHQSEIQILSDNDILSLNNTSGL